MFLWNFVNLFNIHLLNKLVDTKTNKKWVWSFQKFINLQDKWFLSQQGMISNETLSGHVNYCFPWVSLLVTDKGKFELADSFQWNKNCFNLRLTSKTKQEAQWQTKINEHLQQKQKQVEINFFIPIKWPFILYLESDISLSESMSSQNNT